MESYMMGGLGFVLEKLKYTAMGGFSTQGTPKSPPPASAASAASSSALRAAPRASAGHSMGADGALGGIERTYWLDLSYGYRFLHIAESRTDAMFFVESNIQLGGANAQYIAPELLFQSSGRLLLKVGYRFLLSHKETQVPGHGHNMLGVQIEFRL